MIDTVAIIGFGAEGKSLYEYFKDKVIEIHIFDEKVTEFPDDVVIHNDLNIPAYFDVVYKSPGIPVFKITFASKDTKIKGLVNIFFEKAKGKIIGVTGTKGKSTTTSLIYHILKESGLEAEIAGNIGISGLDLLAKDNENMIYVYELSSYMCEMLDSSPHISVWTNFFDDHLDYHLSRENYFNAKANITKYQSNDDFFITINDLDYIETKANKIIVNTKNLRHFETKLLGEHNQINCNLAYHASLLAGVSENNILKAIKTFEPLSGRLEKVFSNNKITIYEDSLATIPEATWAAIESLKNIDTLILGGQDRGIDFEDFANKLKETNIKNIIIFPETGMKMVKYVLDRNIIEVNNMEECVKSIFKICNGICLLSTASPSYNLFKNYKDRSDQFKSWIKIVSKH
ncbi:MAG: UDP-N-acetylmuramoyl-L-alanine--D-glutamate ligase [bacterium]